MKPLTGRTVLITRSREQTGELAEALVASGARVVEAPVIAFADPPDWSPVDDAIAHLDRYDVAVFTSANAVTRFCRRVARSGRRLPGPGGPRIVAIGRATSAALEAQGVVVDRVAVASRAEGVIDLLADEPLAGRRVLIPRAEVAREVLPEQLRARGAQVDIVIVYRTVALPVAPEVRRMLETGAIDVVSFTSSSTVTNLLAGIGGAGTLKGVVIAVIGPVTAETVRSAGLDPAIVAGAARVEDLAVAIASYYARSS